jgi:hypothetical protein
VTIPAAAGFAASWEGFEICVEVSRRNTLATYGFLRRSKPWWLKNDVRVERGQQE